MQEKNIRAGTVVLRLRASTIVWHEDKRGKAADNGDLDLAAAMWQQCGSNVAAVWQQPVAC